MSNSIVHNWNGSPIAQLLVSTKIGKFDVPASYVNGTQMCKACGKLWAHYASLSTTKAYWQALSTDTGIPISELAIAIKGGDESARKNQGTWVHPEIAIDLAQWVSVEFRIWANRTLKQAIEHVKPQPQTLTPIQLIAAMATQMAEQEEKNKELETRLKAVEAEQGRVSEPCGMKYAVVGYANLHGLQISVQVASQIGKKASRLCREQRITIEQIKDPRFGNVNIYPKSILDQAFSELAALTYTSTKS